MVALVSEAALLSEFAPVVLSDGVSEADDRRLSDEKALAVSGAVAEAQ